MSNLHTLHRKKVLLIFGSLDLGGAERQGLYLAEYLKHSCHADVEVWGLKSEPGRLSELCEQKRIRWRGVKCGWGRFSVTRMLKLRRFAKVLKEAKPDIILSYTRFPNLVCGLTWRSSGAGCLIWNQRDEGLLLTRKFWDRLAVRRTPAFVSNSVAGKNFLTTNYGVCPERISIVYNGVEPSVPRESRGGWRERLGLDEERFVACMVANIHPYKDHVTLLKAWGRLMDSLPSGMARPVLLLAGRIDSGREELERVAAESGVADEVRFLGKVDDVAGLLSSVELLVHSSISEGLPNAVLEAMAAGTAVVGTDIPGIREAVGPEGGSFLAPVGDAQMMSSLILQLMQDPELRLSLGASLLKRVSQRFSMGMMCSSVADIIAANAGSAAGASRGRC